ncbi:hypothetical protein [uncultured Acetatifactor sp.]|jgi:hypothetical protein|uniref:hypothetical protein n=1 Tax=uncultured Acetatifactor sp. TaxID=1671927 RepID=UPI00262030D9|nr:hypothetical protein [uncultured Acetatifactor sp.]
MKKICLKSGLSYAAKGFSCIKGIPVDVEDDVAEKLMGTGRFEIADEGLEASEPTDGGSAPADIRSMKKDELIAFAEAHGIDIEGCNNNGERVSRIQDALDVMGFAQADYEEESGGEHEEALD